MQVEYHAIHVGDSRQLERRSAGQRHILTCLEGSPVHLGRRSDTPDLFAESGDSCLLYGEYWQEQGTVCQGGSLHRSIRHVAQ